RRRPLRSIVRLGAWELGRFIGRIRTLRADERTVRRLIYRDQTKSIGVRMTETLRDRLRRRWLRLRRG
ncbi:MAG: hypothetical protein D6744_12260, partial [Planctomycetota bacterium]